MPVELGAQLRQPQPGGAVGDVDDVEQAAAALDVAQERGAEAAIEVRVAYQARQVGDWKRGRGWLDRTGRGTDRGGQLDWRAVRMGAG